MFHLRAMDRSRFPLIRPAGSLDVGIAITVHSRRHHRIRCRGKRDLLAHRRLVNLAPDLVTSTVPPQPQV